MLVLNPQTMEFDVGRIPVSLQADDQRGIARRV